MPHASLRTLTALIREHERVLERLHAHGLVHAAVPLAEARGYTLSDEYLSIRSGIHAPEPAGRRPRPGDAALRKAAQRFEIAADTAAVGVWEFDVAAGSLTWNAWMYRIHGLAPASGEEPFARWLDSVYDDDRERFANDLAKALAGAQEFAVEFRIMRPDGAVRDVKASARVDRDASGAALRMTGACFDITESRRAEQTLLEASSLLRTVLDSTAEISIIAADTAMIIRVFNAGAERLLGYSSAEVVGRATPMLLHDAEELRICGEKLSAQLGLAVDDSAVFAKPPMLNRPREWTYIRKDGGRITVSLVVTPMHSDTGELLGYVCVAHDVTRQKIYEESLRTATGKSDQANRAKSEFLANMSHEIRTPLNAIIGLGYLLEQTTLSEDQRQFLAKIQFAGRALLGVINNVLDLSKIEAGEMSLEDEPYDLPALVRDLSQMLTPQARTRGIELIVRPAADLPRMVRGDASRLRQILTNLVHNSIKFTELGHVELNVTCTEHDSDRIRLRCMVEDTGIGIEPATLARLFTPFTQADASTTRRFGGTGLGLSIARRFVELMGGEIGVASTVGVGSTFWIELPLRIADDIGGDTGLHAATGSTASKGLRIIIADADGDAPGGLGAMVRALGLTSQVAESGAHLLRVLGETPADAWPDVLILDQYLHDMDARQLIASIETDCRRDLLPPVIVIGDDARSYTDQRQLMRSTDVLLVRPVASSALFNAINSAVSRREDGYERILQSANFDSPLAQWLSGVHVLVVDDSDINLEVAQRILEKQGATVSTCMDGWAAVEHVRAHRAQLDIVLMDVQMPILDGNAATRRIRGELGLSTLPIVALTAGALVGERQISLNAGMNDFISKPFEPQALIRKVRRLVEQVRGKPIPMVMSERMLPAKGSEFPLLACIDGSVVKQIFGDDLSLFKSVLTRVLRDYADLALPTALSLEDQSGRNAIMRRTHKLKGSAGMIGAGSVKRLAGAAEEALNAGLAAEVVEEILRKLAAAITHLGEEAQPFLHGRAQADAVGSAALIPAASGLAGAAAVSGAVADIEALCGLFESWNLAAVEKFRVLSGPLEQMFDSVRWDRLGQAVDNLDFQLAAQLVREALTQRAAAPALPAAMATS
jgi:PAS domain S-box-containing protein